MLVCFHPEDPDLLLVSEKVGVLRVYSVERGCSTLFLRCHGPLLDADWSILDPALIVAAGSKGLTVWNLASPQPCSELVEIGGGERVYNVEICRSTPGLVATHSSPHTVRVTHLHSNKVPVAVHLKKIPSNKPTSSLPSLHHSHDVNTWLCLLAKISFPNAHQSWDVKTRLQ
ncbi:hypothetical protein SK128_012755 [Halocaridina rubra]|uniref:Uncharacterized protein n=1 Tax=Halocaridina rubra TaxID=373956 RepID=A0AAN8X5Z5_HALRR